MEHLHFLPSEVNYLSYYSQKWQVDLYAKRDDIAFMSIGGGSKARILQYLLYDLSKYDVLVTAGGPCSNFNRACAIMCAKLGIRFHLIEYTDDPNEFTTSLNYKICKYVGMETTRCKKTDVAKVVPYVIEDMRKQGLRVKNIYGGGKSLEGIFSYYEAVSELNAQIPAIDYVFVACGTGTTLTGICAGLQKSYPNAIVHAVSVARSWDIEKTVLMEDMGLLNSYLSTNYNFDRLIFHEEFLCGGYNKYNEELKNSIRECACNEGILLDPTYSGKAFWGMLNIIKNNNQFKSKRILFWHTGGLFNLLSEL